jgi:hypothetical protein
VTRCEPVDIVVLSLRTFVGWAVALVGLFAFAGCGERGKTFVPVSGVVTLDGKPLAGGNVVFQPVAPAGSTIAGKGSAAVCDESGRFHLETIDGKKGAVVGDHQVRIYGPRKRPQRSNVDGEQPQGPVDIVPTRYNYDTTLTFPVPADGTEQADFVLTTKQQSDNSRGN